MKSETHRFSRVSAAVLEHHDLSVGNSQQTELESRYGNERDNSVTKADEALTARFVPEPGGSWHVSVPCGLGDTCCTEGQGLPPTNTRAESRPKLAPENTRAESGGLAEAEWRDGV